jgi:hypothetical protein
MCGKTNACFALDAISFFWGQDLTNNWHTPSISIFLLNLMDPFNLLIQKKWAYSESRYPKWWFNEKTTTKDYFEFLLHLLFHDYSGLVYDYNYNDVMLMELKNRRIIGYNINVLLSHFK